jgi:hypothetical protein
MTALTTEARLAITAAVTGLGYKVYTSTPAVPIPPSIVIMADSPMGRPRAARTAVVPDAVAPGRRRQPA